MKIVITKRRDQSKVKLIGTNGQEAVTELALALVAAASTTRVDGLPDERVRSSLHGILDYALDMVLGGEADAKPE